MRSRLGMFALIRPVMTSTEGRWVAMIRWMPAALASCARRQIASSTSPGATIIRSASSSTIMTICGRSLGMPSSSLLSFVLRASYYILLSRGHCCLQISDIGPSSPQPPHCNAADAFFGSVTTGISRCGMPLYTLSSTTFGVDHESVSTSEGFALYKMLIISVLMHTDFPEPVDPGDQHMRHFCNVGYDHLAGDVLADCKSNFGWEVRKRIRFQKLPQITTAVVSLFGTSIPIAALPGIGASIRMSVAARFSLISSARPRILLTFTP